MKNIERFVKTLSEDERDQLMSLLSQEESGETKEEESEEHEEEEPEEVKLPMGKPVKKTMEKPVYMK